MRGITFVTIYYGPEREGTKVKCSVRNVVSEPIDRRERGKLPKTTHLDRSFAESKETKGRNHSLTPLQPERKRCGEKGAKALLGKKKAHPSEKLKKERGHADDGKSTLKS